MSRLKRWLMSSAMLLVLAVPTVSTARAQEEGEVPQVAGEEEGSPTMGYGAVIAIAGLAIFIVCKSARRDLA